MGKPKLVDRFNDLSDDKKTLVLKELLVSYNNNEYIDNEDKKKIYDMYKNIIENIDHVKDLIDLKNSIAIFNSLPEKRKWNVLRKFLDELYRQNKEFIQDKREAKCSKLGHIYNEWNKDYWTTISDAYFDREVIHDYKETHEYWYRTCARCGYVDKVYKKPQELIDEEQRKQNDSEIKELEKRLRKLKGE